MTCQRRKISIDFLYICVRLRQNSGHLLKNKFFLNHQFFTACSCTDLAYNETCISSNKKIEISFALADLILSIGQIRF